MPGVAVHHQNVPPVEWDSLAAGAPLSATPAWLRSVEHRAQGEGHYFVVSDDSAARGGLFGFVAATPRTDDAFNLYDVLTGTPRTMPLSDDAVDARARLRDGGPPAEAWFPNLVLTLPSAECVPVGPDANDADAMRQLTAAAVELARGGGMAAVSVLYLRRRYEALAGALAAEGFTRLPASLTAELHLPGDGFDDYLAVLSKDRRRSVRKELATVEEAGVTVSRRDLAETLDDVLELRLALKRKYGRTPNPDKERSSLTALLREFEPEQLHLLVAEIDGEPIGFGLDVIHDGVWNGVVSGTNYDDPRSDSVSFCLDFYWPIRRAYEVGVREFQFGMAAWEAKRNRGCDLVSVDAYVLPLRDELRPTVDAVPAATGLRFTPRQR